ncbi:hypothetical protein PMIN03_002592 [Paraphaeosphaeria minitans]
MPPDSSKAATAGKKRKFGVYALDQSLVYFNIGRNVYSVEEALLDERCGGPAWTRLIRHRIRSKVTVSEDRYEDIVWKACHGCPHDWRELHESPCILRGFIYWLYEHEVPSDEIIKQMDFPSDWNSIGGKKPLALVMAVHLYLLAWNAGLRRLSLEMLQFIFTHFKKSRSVPQTGLVRLLYSFGGRSDKMPLQKFFVDIYHKWCDEDTMGLEEEYPPRFLFDMMKLKTNATGSSLE